MFRGRCPSRNAKTVLRIARSHYATPRRTFTTQPPYYQGLPPVRLLGPTIWCLATAGAIYLGCAASDVYQDVARAKGEGTRWASKRPPETFEELERFRGTSYAGTRSARSWSPFSELSGLSELAEFSEPEKLIVSAIALNTGLHASCRGSPAFWGHLAHVPVSTRNYTLLTSVFGHAGLLHLGFNMYGLFMVGPPVAQTRTFNDNGHHLAAFYLATGILTSLAQHISSIGPHRMNRFQPSLGASGAIMAILGAFGMSYPDTHIGILFLPGSLPASQFLAGVALFDAIGIFVRYPWINWAHAAHLAGLSLGASYVYFGGDKRVWRPTRRLAFNTMRLLNVI
ncbi:Uu.00g107280.m01.CDS01 [Anthostomella pinea]|uniref:Uu.00g107280.m01.CDS01 n=1 Tax=Anthostomella pinea TaxID=933095 RepID=A0AAI8VET4_9PEZI|nr:Uu.00g107280.m01.CDS01 [Anthostomella pinea]